MLTEGMYIADRYEILGKVGAGGMSDVYKAKDLTLGRFVAIKVLKAEFSEDINFVTKFRSEAQAAAGLEHPNIVNIYDVGSENGLHYIVMEYVEGITLKTYIEKKGQLSFKEAVSIAIQVGRGIEAAHNKNIVHRDIKPQNIMISTEGKVKVTDFGIARAATSNTISSDVMGETAGRLSDVTILTSDNPRYEKPEAILSDIEQGMKRTKGKYKIIPDRREAISYAISQAQEGDLIVVAGKGHEEYQEIEGHFYPMNEREMIENSI